MSNNAPAAPSAHAAAAAYIARRAAAPADRAGAEAEEAAWIAAARAVVEATRARARVGAAHGCDHYWLVRRGGQCKNCGVGFPKP
jgi:hypothetical protein